MSEKPNLYLVPPIPVPPKQRIRAKVKRHPKPDGTLYCPVCLGRALAIIEGGTIIKDGKRKRGTILEKDICAICYQRGQTVQMVQDPDPPKFV